MFQAIFDVFKDTASTPDNVSSNDIMMVNNDMGNTYVERSSCGQIDLP
jgi:hypothetical protein